MVDPSTLPVEEIRAEFDAACEEHAFVVLSAPTGSGKSTRLPVWLEASGRRVLVVEPRRVACRSLATYVGESHGGVGKRFGYRVRFEERTSGDTRVCFVTPGVALNLFASGDIADYDTLMIDELHERSWEVDLLVALARRAIRTGAIRTVVLCSATIAAAEVAASLGGKVLEAHGRLFDVAVSYRGAGPPSADDLDARVAEAVREVLTEAPHGDVLVFLPGKGEIERSHRALESPPVAAELVRVHGGVPPRELAAAFRAMDGRRRIYLATNVAESAVTLPGVRTVIDSGLARGRVHRAGRSVLALSPIAGDSMDQRAGRAGRVAEGSCIRLWGSRYTPREATAPEVSRIELDDVVLRAGACGIPPAELTSLAWLTPPPTRALEEATARLEQTGAIASGALTSRGARLASLPVSAVEARMLLDPPPALAATVADLVALLEVGRDLLWTRDGADPRIDRARMVLLDHARDEVGVQLMLLREGNVREHGLHAAALAESRRLATSLRALVGVRTKVTDRNQPAPDRQALAAFLLGRVPEAGFVRRARADRKSRGRGDRRGRGPLREPWGNGDVELWVAPYQLPGFEEDEQPEAPKAALILSHEWLGEGRSAQGRGRMLLPCRYEDLCRADLGELEVSGSTLRRGAVVGQMRRTLAGVVLEEGTQPLVGASLHDAVTELVFAGRLRKGLAAALEQDVHLLSLVDPSASSEEDRDPRVWLRARLDRLGVQESEDLGLLEDDDLRIDVAARAQARGIDAHELGKLAADFPRSFVDRDGIYVVCRVDLDRHRVVLEPANARARKLGEPKTAVIPRFRGFSVFFQQASRRVKLR